MRRFSTMRRAAGELVGHFDWTVDDADAEASDALFINARVDTFICGVSDPAEAVTRARLYTAAGANYVYPILAPAEMLPVLRAGIDGPLNAVAVPTGPPFAELRLGATRLVFGPGLQRRAMEAVRELADQLVNR